MEGSHQSWLNHAIALSEARQGFAAVPLTQFHKEERKKIRARERERGMEEKSRFRKH